MVTLEFDFSKKKRMTAKASLCKYLLSGYTLNIKNCFTLIGLTNCPREISRMVEKPFNVEVSRIRREGISRFGQTVTWFDYHLKTFTKKNKEGVELMKTYVKDNS